MIIFALALLILLLWWPLPKKNEWALCWTGILLLLIGGQICYPENVTAISLGTASLLTWLELISLVLIRRFSKESRLIIDNCKAFALIILNLIFWLPLLFKSGEQFSWLGHQVILIAQIVNGITTLGLLIFWATTIILQAFSKPISADYLIVLGAGLCHGKVPPVLAARLQQAISCWRLNNKSIIVVSGGLLRGAKLSEAQAMADYLISHGIPQNKILLEEQAQNTWANLQNCQKLLQKWIKPNQKVVVVTSSFHVLRTKSYLQKLGLNWALSPSRTPWKLQSLTVIRDYLGILRDHYRVWLGLLIIAIIVGEVWLR
ncbi:YdcF family protein [Limosilactobacillus fastidiosus]|uniref:YdcF family protein n=1 Tax=Limosilactobacillus fastidiosus TaxID=2759855 RepID=A0A7W3YCK2_9LACO|nr:YdcF family protein [Limosilactobacillus fastidiosus]MBB1063336.1 YdcF family protein [Limosilactobacillus fastidiosus]MBB1086310.1 YdcF family protein [Limosilactobacillus fastidiosus]MCD7084492.1 YdcF family protein [Limosilactobacillus fastidiosus]MCD7086415.1 YdcF family protein [Limosilactobacillus fastidiosus]MCD7114229.1 YdcF family protein [Limosilactobacillus fastidiosus]